jgi:hypothetical protein
VLVAFQEETAYRGYAFQRLVDELRSWTTGGKVATDESSHSVMKHVMTALAVIIMALFFAIQHWDNPGMSGATKIWATTNIALAGALFGICYVKTQSLAIPIGMHVGWNWAQGNLLGFGVSGTTDTPGFLKPVFHAKPIWLTGGSFGLEASALCTFICTAAIVVALVWKPKSPETTPES